MEPPGKENATGEGGALRTDYDAVTVTENSREVNTSPMPPEGFGYFYDREGKLTYERCADAPQEDFTDDERQRLDVIGPVIEWCHGSKARLAALQYLGGLDRRTVAEIAKTHKISASIVHREIGKLRAFIGALRP